MVKAIRTFVANNRGALSAWLGLSALAQGISAASARPDVVWPVALGIGALVYSCSETVIDWALARAAKQADGGKP